MKYSNTSLYGTTPIRNSILDVLDYREIPAVTSVICRNFF